VVLEKKLMEFSVDLFVERSAQNLAAEMGRQGFKGLVLGASGGIDSLVTMALCLRARKKSDKWPVVAFQMNDSRVKGEFYNPEVYRYLGADLIQTDITTDAIDTEKRLGMPPRWLTVCLMKLVLRWVPTNISRRVIVAVKAGEVPKWVLIHYQVLILLHRLRIVRLKEYATQHRLMVVTCANMTEASLGYFVEQGVDDPHMGDCAPLSGLYKSQVIRVAQFIGLPEHTMLQRPSPGFGGIYDDEIMGPYELVDLILIGLSLGYSDAEITQALRPSVDKWTKTGFLKRKKFYDIHYVRFIRQLAELNAQKRHPEKPEEKTLLPMLGP
jgi:NAD+ synthase